MPSVWQRTLVLSLATNAVASYSSAPSSWMSSQGPSSAIYPLSSQPLYSNTSDALTTTLDTSQRKTTVWVTLTTTVATVCPMDDEATGSESTTVTVVSTITATSSYATVLTDNATEAPSSAASPDLSSDVSTASEASSSSVSSATSSPTSISRADSNAWSGSQAGNSTWGTLDVGCFPKWLPKPDGSRYTEAPWGNLTNINADATVIGDVPSTDVTRYYELTISRGRISPDGVLRDVILVNGQYPGPAIEANWGDMLSITVHNQIYNPDEGSAMHWHGMLQRNFQWFDGVPSVSQCPIAPGHSFTYVFQAELYGTSWYHAHYSAQYTAGVLGPMIVYGPSEVDYDCDIGPVMLSDWYHYPYFSVITDVVGTDLTRIPPVSDNTLIQGRGNFTCSKAQGNGTYLLASGFNSTLNLFECANSSSLSQFRFQAGKTHRIRLVNHGADGLQKFHIDGVNLTVIAVDYVPVQPYTTSTVLLAVGQRTDILVTAPNDTTATYWMRSENVGGIPCGGAKNPLGLAAIYHEDADTSVLPSTVSDSPVNQTACQYEMPVTTPRYSITPSKPSFYQDLVVTLDLNSTGSYEWRLNNQTFRANFNIPLLPEVAAGNISFPDQPQWNIYNYDQNSSIVFNLTNNTPFIHPFHMHGHNFYVLASGDGLWDGNIPNTTNPERRDTFIVPPLGHAVFQMEADNPGVWPFHCHVAWHLSGGLQMNIVSRPQDIPAIPSNVLEQTCSDWDYYSNRNVVDQIDAGA